MSTKPSTRTTAAVTSPDPEVRERPQRRQFSAADKLRILAETDRAQPGEIGAILRREGLYSSNLTRWRRQRDQGALQGLTPPKPGPKRPAPDPKQAEVSRLERENAQLRERLERAEAVISLQKNWNGKVG